MHTVALFGAGKIGEAIIALLSLSGRYNIKVCDRNLDSAHRLCQDRANCRPHQIDLDQNADLSDVLQGCQAIINALPFTYGLRVAELAGAHSLHYLDLTEDVSTTKGVIKLAKESKNSAFIPQCGLAPGFISIAAAHIMKLFEVVESVKMRVGALPIYPSNLLKYNLTWSTLGLINEYRQMCELIHDGKKQLAFPLEGYERFSLDGVEYEAFNTSGGLGTLCESMEGQLRDLDYKSIRYPGHCDLVAFLFNDLKFKDEPETLKQVLERGIPSTAQDKCIIFVEVQGQQAGRFMQQTYASTIYNDLIGKQHFGAIQICTASAICAVLDLLLNNRLPRSKGLIRNEEIKLTAFLENEFGKRYKDDNALRGLLS